MDIRAWDDERKTWEVCRSLGYDRRLNLWRHTQRWSDGSEEWLYDIEICVDGKWLKLNDKQ